MHYPKSRSEFETALDNRQLWAAMRNGRYWLLRRNGRTQTWKTRPDEYSIPVKAGLRSCARITKMDEGTDAFVISDSDPNTRR